MNSEDFVGVWYGAYGTRDRYDAIEVVLLADGTGAYDEEHNLSGVLTEVEWSFAGNSLKITDVSKHLHDIPFLCGEVVYTKGVPCGEGYADMFYIVGHEQFRFFKTGLVATAGFIQDMRNWLVAHKSEGD